MLLMVLIAPWAMAQQALPYSYGFEDNDLSVDGWSNVSGSIGSTARTGSYGFDFNFSISSDAYLMSPVLTGGTNGVNVSFYAKARSGSYLDHFQIGYTTDATVTDPSAFTYGSLITSTTSWKEYTAECPAGTVRVAIKYDTDNYNDGWDLYLDDFTFEAPASCKTPTGLTATNLTTESATLGWTAPDPAPDNGYNVRYRTALVEHPTFFDSFEDGLTQWTIIRNLEGTESTDWHQFNGNFSGNSIAAHSGTYMAMSRSWATDDYNVDNWLITPQVTLDGTLKFWVMDDGTYHDYYAVYVSTTGNTVADFGSTPLYVPGDASAEWTEVTVDLSSFAGVSGYVALRHTDYAQDYLLIDDFGIYGDPTPAGAWTNKTTSTNSLNISGLTENTLYDFEVQSNCGGETSEWVASTFRTNPSCMPVANLAVSDVTTTTVSLTWTDQNNGSASYIITDGNDNAVTVTNLTATGCTVIELTANTLYTFKVSADCGSTVETIQVRTDCNALSTIPYNEGFEASSEIIYCWELDGFARLNNPTYAHTGNVSLYGSEDLAYAILPVTTANTSALMLNFWWTNGYSGYDMGSLEVGYITDIDDYSTFVNVGTIDMSTSISEYEHTDDFVFDGAPDGSRIAFKYNEGTYAQVLIDDVRVEYKPACMRPTNLVASNPTGHGATFEWDGNGSITEDGWQLYFSEDADAVSGYDSPAGVIDADTNPFTVTSGLKPETDYYVWVRSHCEYTGYSPWSIPATFTTTEACPAPTGLAASEVTGHTAKLSWTGTSESYVLSVGTYDYTGTPVMGTVLEEDFEDGQMQGWTTISNDGDSNAWTIESTSGYAHNGSKFARSRYTSSSLGAAPDDWLISPQIPFGGTFSFYARRYSTTYTDQFRVYVSTTGNNISDFTPISEVISPNATYDLYEYDLSSYSGSGYVAIQYTGLNNQYYVYVDDITITGPIYPIAWQEYNTTDLYKTVGDLDPETPYFAKVKGYCGTDDGYSQETAVISFTTDIACPAPTGLTASNPTSMSFDLQWTNGGAANWVLAYKKTTAASFTEIDLDESDVTIEGDLRTYTLGGLDAETEYIVKVQDNCEASYAGDGQSEWTAEVNYSTIAACSALNPVVSDITHHNATVNFEGESASGFTVNYRVAAGEDALFEEGFENGLGSWTFTSMNAVNGIGGSGTYPAGIQSAAAHSDSYGFRFSSYTKKDNGEAYDQYLVSPELTVTGTLKFYAWRYGANDKIYVGYSTTTNDLDAFTWDEESLAFESNSSWKEFTHELPDNVKYIAYHYFGDYAFYAYVDDIAITVPTSAGAWQPQAATGTTADLTGLTAGTKYDLKVVPNCDETLESATVQFTTLVGNMKYFLTAGEWGTAANWMDEEIPDITDNATIRADVTIAKNYVAYAKNITRENSATVTIKDGGELYHNNAVYSATMEKEIVGATTWGTGTTASDGWYVISNPLSYTSYTPTNTTYVTNLAPADVSSVHQFDLYKYRENNMDWYNYHKHESGYYLTPGVGFLYARNGDAKISFMSGTYYSLPVADVTPTLTFTEANGEMAGWNLLGNPFSHSITWDNIVATNVNTTGYYKLGNDGAWTADPSTTTAIKPMEGFLVKATAASPTLTIKNVAASSKGRANNDFLAFTIANSNYSDVTYAMFSDGEGLEKINHRNADIHMAYIPQDGERYAIATMGDDTEMFNLNFKAMTTGEYTLSYKAEGSFSYLHIIDRMTGEDIDMLIEDEYTFIGSPRDDENRFIVKLRYNANGNIGANDIFAYQNGDEIIVNGEGELQIFDVMGRFVTSMKVNGSERFSASTYANGVYVFRMVGETVKTQKIVVR